MSNESVKTDLCFSKRVELNCEICAISHYSVQSILVYVYDYLWEN